MVKIHPKSMEYKIHSLVANKEVGSMQQGDMRDCLIIAMTDGRFAVFSYRFTDAYYVVLKDENELHESFNEQLAI